MYSMASDVPNCHLNLQQAPQHRPYDYLTRIPRLVMGAWDLEWTEAGHSRRQCRVDCHADVDPDNVELRLCWLDLFNFGASMGQPESKDELGYDADHGSLMQLGMLR